LRLKTFLEKVCDGSGPFEVEETFLVSRRTIVIRRTTSLRRASVHRHPGNRLSAIRGHRAFDARIGLAYCQGTEQESDKKQQKVNRPPKPPYKSIPQHTDVPRPYIPGSFIPAIRRAKLGLPICLNIFFI
jgi:hypothetical protein